MNAALPLDVKIPPSMPAHAEKRHRFLVLDGVRGVAILSVLLTHGSYVMQSRLVSRTFQLGWTGVDLFFVLSGFLITGILLDTKSAVNRAGSFYARRVLRIFPIYYLTIAVVLVAQSHWAWVAAAAEMSTWQSRLPYLLYYVNLIPLWHHGETHQSLLLHFWSLAVEEQFYFVWPLIVWHISTRAVVRLCGVALCLGLAFRVATGLYYGFGLWQFSFPFCRADGLFVGSALAALLACHYQPSKRVLISAAAAGGVGLAIIALNGRLQLYYGGPLMNTFGFSSVAILCGALVSGSLHSKGSLLSRALEARWIRNVGKYSYGMYVFHLPVFFFAEHVARAKGVLFPLPSMYAALYLGLLIVVTYGLAWVSFHAFEQRFLGLKEYCEPRFAPGSRDARLAHPREAQDLPAAV